MSNDRVMAFLERNRDKISIGVRPKYAPVINVVRRSGKSRETNLVNKEMVNDKHPSRNEFPSDKKPEFKYKPVLNASSKPTEDKNQRPIYR
jgi:hypothetical protein